MTSTVWRVMAGGRTFSVRTCSARAALRRAELATGATATIIGIEMGTSPVRRRPTTSTRHSRKKRTLLPDAVRRLAAGESIAEIARRVGVPRETLRDWLRTIDASAA